RRLKASFQAEDGSTVSREAGTPQGRLISPVLVNLFLHFIFDDSWGKNFLTYSGLDTQTMVSSIAYS
ncbi:hypothetical protein ACPTGY_14030, partial [Enterococcus faecalis]